MPTTEPTIEEKAPEKIWLQWYGDGSPDDLGEVSVADVTWEREKIFEHDIEYTCAPQPATSPSDEVKLRARAEALEEAAKIVETRWATLSVGKVAIHLQAEVERNAIAASIRALKPDFTASALQSSGEVQSERPSKRDWEAGFLKTIAEGLRHAIQDHGPITKEWIGSASKRVYTRLRGTKYDAARHFTASDVD